MPDGHDSEPREDSDTEGSGTMADDGVSDTINVSTAHGAADDAAVRHDGQRAECTHGVWARHTVTKSAGSTCCRCAMHKRHGQQMYQCTECKALVCGKCRVTRTAAKSILESMGMASVCPEPATSGQSTGGASAPKGMEWKALEHIWARELPTTVIWIPRKLKARFARVMATLIHMAADATHLDEDSATRAHLLLLTSPVLLLRAPTKDSAIGCIPEAKKRSMSTTELIRKRLVLAEADAWEVLVAQMSEEMMTYSPSEYHRLQEVSDAAATTRMFGAAMRKAGGGCLETAKRMLTGQKVRKWDHAVRAEVRRLMPRETMTETEEQHMHQLVSECLEAHIHAPSPQQGTVARRVNLLKMAAEPGRSKLRNTHVAAIAETREGMAALTRWCGMWAKGQWRPCEVRMWTNALIMPLAKGEHDDGVKLRPIALCEAMLKLAEGVVMDLTGEGLRIWAEPDQLSIRTPDGAGRMVRTLQSVVATRGDKFVLMQGDIVNAYGQVSRAAVLRAALSECPSIAPILACQWSATTSIWMPPEGGETGMVEHEVNRGVWQGSSLSNPAFCLPLMKAIRSVVAEYNAAHPGAAHVLAYADDFVVVAEKYHANSVWGDIISGLQTIGLTLASEKCSAWAPGDPTWTSTHGLMTHADGLPLLGSDASADFEAVLTEGPDAGKCFRTRVQKSMQLMDTLQQVHRTDIQEPKCHGLWLLLSKCALRAVDYDIRLLHPDLVCPEVATMERKARDTMELLLGQRMDDNAWRQCQLPGPLGGCGGRLPSTVACVAFRAAAVAHDKEVRIAVQRVTGCSCSEVQVLHAHVDTEAAGITIGQNGEITNTASATECMAKCKLVEPRSEQERTYGFPKLISRALRIVEGVRAAELYDRMDDVHRTRWFSCAGPEAGILWTDVPRDNIECLPDTHWRCATAARLSIGGNHVGARCAHRKEGCGTRCDQPCGEWAQHGAVCAVASSRLRAHRQMVHVVAAQLKRAGAEVDIERAVPEWAGRGPKGAPEEAVMDIVARWPGTNQLHYLDVTIRAAWAARYAESATLPGCSAQAAWREKRRRYPSVHGIEVTPIAYESSGRLHDQSAAWMRERANEAAARSGRPQSGKVLYRRWRHEQDRALALVEADVSMTCLGGGARRFQQRVDRPPRGQAQAADGPGALLTDLADTTARGGAR